jgi:hypothetical protein
MAPCDRPDDGFLNRLKAGIVLLAGQFREPIGNGAVGCPYTDTVPAEFLFGSPEDVREIVGPLIKDRIVLLGVAYSGSNDLVPTPIHGRLPGVYLHAMALDNLITQDGGYIRKPPDLQDKDDPGYWLLGSLSVASVLEVISIQLMQWIYVRLRSGEDRIRDRARRPDEEGGSPFLRNLSATMLTGPALLVAMAFSASLIAWLIATVLLYPPVNWLGILGVLIVLRGAAGSRPPIGNERQGISHTGNVP